MDLPLPELPNSPAPPETFSKGFAEFFAWAKAMLHKHLPQVEAETLWEAGNQIGDVGRRAKFFSDALEDIEAILAKQPAKKLVGRTVWKWQPVDPKTFLCSPEYLNKGGEVYPEVLKEYIEINSGKYTEVVCVGGIGSAKTSVALYSQAYQLYLLSCMSDPHGAFGLDKSSEMLIIFQSINKTLALGVDYQRFRTMIADSPYFKAKFPHDPKIETRLVFPNRIEVRPVSGLETAAIGQNVIGGIIDELNYMAVVQRSASGTSGDGGEYNQAVAVYNSIARRRKSRFARNGSLLPGLLCLVSSRKYPGQFTDLKEAEAKVDPTIYIYDKCVWDIKPPGTFGEARFRVFKGHETLKPRIIPDGEEPRAEERDHIKLVPLEFRGEFERDIIDALREIAGVSTLARHPFFRDYASVQRSFRAQQKSIFGDDWCDFEKKKLVVYPGRIHKRHLPRFAHVDLAVNGDSAGLAIGTVLGFVPLQRLGFGNTEEMAPVIWIDGLLEIRPPPGGEVPFHKVREVLTKLRDLGMNLRWVTYDSYQSVDSLQLLKQGGFVVGKQSMDLTVVPYEILKATMYSRRLLAPSHLKCAKEIVMLEKDSKTGKVDHPMTFSKDVADALAGCVYGLTTRREVWALYDVPTINAPKEFFASAAPQADPIEMGRIASRLEQVYKMHQAGITHART